MVSIRLILFLAFCIGYITATNYCSKNICPAGKKHIACGHNGKFSRKCPRSASMVKFPWSLRRLVLHRHNIKRNKIASGRVRNYKPACRMATMRWSKELASLAALNVRQCEMKHDACRNTKYFKFAGQNVARLAFRRKPNKRHLITKAINMWYNELSNSNMAHINSFPSNTNQKIGHFTVMVAERNIRVGCAASTYTDNGFKQFLFACNYATTNMERRPVYTSCRRPAAKCRRGRNRRYRNLCSIKESYKVNKW
ncbi:antigen 5 like allergen Cul n 1-like [Haematobia irritans]|uniref:antigen 5 like allergen Cul n 1-like n=1 Tax=Haematobia irritans TaxID=7368 RepID=UPI003F501AD9